MQENYSIQPFNKVMKIGKMLIWFKVKKAFHLLEGFFYQNIAASHWDKSGLVSQVFNSNTVID